MRLHRNFFRNDFVVVVLLGLIVMLFNFLTGTVRSSGADSLDVCGHYQFK